MILLGKRTYKAPAVSGLYAWYFKPKLELPAKDLGKALTYLMARQSNVRLEVRYPYGLVSTAHTSTSGDVKRGQGSLEDFVQNALVDGGEYLRRFLTEHFVPTFSRPLYIGVTNDLRRRLYREHFQQLTEYWGDERLESFLLANERATIEDVQLAFALPHSFALHARVLRIRPNDLVVTLFESEQLKDWVENDEDNTNKSVETLLQLMANPICGRM